MTQLGKRQVRFRCDVCKREFWQPAAIGQTYLYFAHPNREVKDGEPISSGRQYDLCEDCRCEVQRFVEGITKQTGIEEWGGL